MSFEKSAVECADDDAVLRGDAEEEAQAALKEELLEKQDRLDDLTSDAWSFL
jgi:hypothetical protein